MIPSNSEEYVSIIGSGYLHPISSLLERLNALNPKGHNEVKASTLEYSYSAAIIILAVLMLESIINAAQSNRDDKPLKPVDYVCKTYPNSSFKNILTEIFVVRDVIAHNHLWTAEFFWDEQADMKLVSAAELQKGYGDKKFKTVLNPGEQRTRELGINLVPTRLCHADTMLVLKTIVEFLLFLEEKDSKYVGISQQYVQHGGHVIRFMDLVGL